MMTSLIHLASALPFLALGSLAAGLALAPAIAVFQGASAWAEGSATWLYYIKLGLGGAIGFYVYGFSLLLVAPSLNYLLRGRLKPWRGPSVSMGCIPWYVHATLTLVVRYSFLEFVTPTEFSKIYFRLMGMTIGRNVTINSTCIADPSLIYLGDGATIGGSANIMAHYGQGGYLVIAPVRIGKGATIGLRATLMGGVEVGDKAKILANSFVLPNTKIPAGESWGGIPAIKVEIPKSESTGAKDRVVIT